MSGTVYVWSRNSVLPDRLQYCLRGDMHVELRDYNQLADTAPLDYWIVPMLSATEERSALQHHAVTVVLPAATVWLAAEIDRLTASGNDVAIAYRRPPK